MPKNNLFYIILGITLIVIAVTIWSFSRNDGQEQVRNVATFEECVAAGYPVMESYPRQCRTPEGQLFIEEIQNGETNDKNGDAEDNGMPLVVFGPTPNQTVSSPVSVSGHAVGNWYFEASFPVRVLDANSTELGVSPVQAEGEWMTTAYVPFSGSVSFATPTTETGFLVFQKDNPSGLPENDEEVSVPVRFATMSDEKKPITLKVFFYNNTLLQPGQDDCVTVFPVERTVPYTLGVGKAALEELLKDATPTERALGYGSSLNSGVKLNNLKIENGVAYADFDDTLDRGVGGSCRVSSIRAQITETLKQFPTVNDVMISIEGETDEILQP